MSDNFTLFFENRHYPKGKSGPDFKRDFNFPHRSGVAFFNQNTFFASGINDGGSVYFENRAAATFAKLKDWVKEAFGDDTPVESEYQPGTVYYRIFRPVITGSFYRPISQEKLTGSFVALRILLDKLGEVFETIEPSPTNASVYGHKIREALMIACMEVESSWTAVLKENHYSLGGQLTTRDYVKLRDPSTATNYLCSHISFSIFYAVSRLGRQSTNTIASLV